MSEEELKAAELDTYKMTKFTEEQAVQMVREVGGLEPITDKGARLHFLTTEELINLVNLAAERSVVEVGKDTRWISVKDQLPKPRQFVLISYTTHYGKRRTTMGWYAPAKTVEASDFSEEVDDEYDEETDTYYLKEGWVDESVESEWHYSISNVTHWIPLPKAPEIAAEKGQSS